MKKGFTLIELLVVMVIVGILVTIAYPSYKEYITRARRSDGQASLVDLASRLEKYYSEKNTYQKATIGIGRANDVLSSAASPEGWYILSITNSTANSYSLQATPTGAQATADNKCQSLTLNNLGLKGVTAGPGGSPTDVASNCW